MQAKNLPASSGSCWSALMTLSRLGRISVFASVACFIVRMQVCASVTTDRPRDLGGCRLDLFATQSKPVERLMAFNKRAPPVGISLIPLYGLRQSGLKGDLRTPVKLASYPTAIDRIT
jgi:hypothetical protein